MADPARDIFEEFRSRQYARIEECLQGEGEPESPYLDFKENRVKSGPNDTVIDTKGILDEHGKRVFAKAASAFANAGGGVLVWGIEDDKERAYKAHPIPNIEQFRVLVEKATPDIVTPALGGIEHFRIDHPEKPGAGFLVTYVPEGKVKPHMSSVKGLYTYHIRSATSSVVMPDAAVRAFVIAGERPSLTVESLLGESKFVQGVMSNNPESNRPTRIMITVFISVINDGNAVAEIPAVAIEDLPSFKWVTGEMMGKTLIDHGGTLMLAQFMRLRNHDPIYPGTSVSVAKIEATVTANQTREKDVMFRAAQDLRIRYWVYARNFTKSEVLVVPASEIHFP